MYLKRLATRANLIAYQEQGSAERQGLTAAIDNVPAWDSLRLRHLIDVIAEFVCLLHKVLIQFTLLHLIQPTQVVPSSRAVENKTFPCGEEQLDTFTRKVEHLDLTGIPYKE